MLHHTQSTGLGVWLGTTLLTPSSCWDPFSFFGGCCQVQLHLVRLHIFSRRSEYQASTLYPYKHEKHKLQTSSSRHGVLLLPH